MSLPKILDENHVAEAAELVRRYYAPLPSTKQPRSGARFDDWAGGGDSLENRNRITADDLMAVSFLSVEIRPHAAIGLLETHVDEVEGFLEQIPTDVDLADADIDKLNSPDSAPHQLWDLLRGKKYGKWHVGPTRASKIMARKRPKLIPIYDSVVRPLLGLNDSKDYWLTYHAALNDGSGLPDRLEEIQRAAETPIEISPIRTMDIVLWMHGKDRGFRTKDDSDD